jgi:hypothetical protein
MGVILALMMTGALVSGCGSATTSASSASSAGLAGSTAVGSCPTSNTKAFAKSRFVLHAGLAFGTSHRYLYKPWEAGKFHSGAHGRILAFVKAGLAVTYIQREIRLAAGDVEANPSLCKLIAAPLRTLSTDLGGAVGQLRGGSAAGVQGAEASLGSTTSLAKTQGVSIVDNNTASVG